MQKRIKLCDRALPNYTYAEELTNTLTHAVGCLGGMAALVLCVVKAALNYSATEVVAAAIYVVDAGDAVQADQAHPVEIGRAHV